MKNRNKRFRQRNANTPPAGKLRHKGRQRRQAPSLSGGEGVKIPFAM